MTRSCTSMALSITCRKPRADNALGEDVPFLSGHTFHRHWISYLAVPLPQLRRPLHIRLKYRVRLAHSCKVSACGCCLGTD